MRKVYTYLTKKRSYILTQVHTITISSRKLIISYQTISLIILIYRERPFSQAILPVSLINIKNNHNSYNTHDNKIDNNKNTNNANNITTNNNKY